MTPGAPAGPRITVVLADDHPVVLAGVRSLLQADPGLELVGEAPDGSAALAVITATLPHVAVVDVSMPGLTGVELTQRLSETCPGVGVIVMTVHEDRAYVQTLIQSGARGYLLKRSAAEDLVRAVRAVAGGGMYLDPAIAEFALGKPAASNKAAPAGDGDLSPRETDVLRFTAQGYSNKEIAARLELSVKSVETYKARAADKLGLKSRAEIVRFGVSRNWLEEMKGPTTS